MMFQSRLSYGINVISDEWIDYFEQVMNSNNANLIIYGRASMEFITNAID